MTERYEPASDFLKAVIADEVPLDGSVLADANVERLIAMTREADRSNRDWAILLLSQRDDDTVVVREALLYAARDEDAAVRGEAILGLARRDRMLALPLLQSALAGPNANINLFEAAAIVAHPSLIDDLRAFAEPSGDSLIDGMALAALNACENATATE